VLEGAVPDEALRDLRQATANLQLAYASAASSGRSPAEDKADDDDAAREDDEDAQG
jgi:hypothetical protein